MKMSDKWTRDTGLVFALLFLILGWKGNVYFLAASAVLLVVVLFMPIVLVPLAWTWLKLAEILSFVMNRAFFGLVFFLVIVPMGFLKRIFAGDQRDFQLQPAKKSAFIEREVVIGPQDLANPF
jgi:hypothetical protein